MHSLILDLALALCQLCLLTLSAISVGSAGRRAHATNGMKIAFQPVPISSLLAIKHQMEFFESNKSTMLLPTFDNATIAHMEVGVTSMGPINAKSATIIFLSTSLNVGNAGSWPVPGAGETGFEAQSSRWERRF